MTIAEWINSQVTEMSGQCRDMVHFDLDSIFKVTGVDDLHARIGFLSDFVRALRKSSPLTEVSGYYSIGDN